MLVDNHIQLIYKTINPIYLTLGKGFNIEKPRYKLPRLRVFYKAFRLRDNPLIIRYSIEVIDLFVFVLGLLILKRFLLPIIWISNHIRILTIGIIIKD